MRTRKWKASTVTVGAAALLGLTTISALGVSSVGAAVPTRALLSGSEVSSIARQHPVGAVANSSRVSFELVLQLRDAAAAEALVKAISSPGSPSYRHYVTRAEWEARFSPSLSEVGKASSWLRSEGFKVGSVSKDRITISASGTAAQIEKAFSTGLEYYRVAGHVVRYATRTLSVPASLGHMVVGAMGVNENIATPAVAGSPSRSESSAASGSSPFPPAPAAFIRGNPCGAYYGAKTTTVKPPFGRGYPTTVPDQVCGYEPGQLQSAYGLGSSDTGAGVTVAIIDAYGSATIDSDATRYFNTYDPSQPFSNANFTQDLALPFDDQNECGASGWSTEQDLDVESVHTMAPEANILYVGAQDCINGLFTAEQNVIDGGLANVVTNSWGDTGGDLLDDAATHTAYDDLFMLADSSGMSVLFSSGDDGDNFDIFGFSVPDFPASSPYVTGVGGTTLQIGQNGQQTGQLAWETGRSFLCTKNIASDVGCTAGTWLSTTFDGGGGGYASYYYSEPWYQVPVVPAPIADRLAPVYGVATRSVPDISMDADPATGLLMGLHMTYPNGKVHYGLTRYGGTSLASPLLAGVVADVDQVSGVAVGFINPVIYKLSSNSGAIDDILRGGHQAQARYDHAFNYVPGASGVIESFREIAETNVSEVFCDGTDNCTKRPMTLTAGPGYDSATGLGSIGPDFVSDVAST
ncbi:MAG: S53 family peptidase [Acidimicrobiales bacterium]